MSEGRLALREGDEITCEGGHLIARVARPIRKGEAVRCSALAFDPAQPRYEPYDTVQPCALCGAPWHEERGGNRFALHVRGRGYTPRRGDHAYT